jgi:hypothetical protein
MQMLMGKFISKSISLVATLGIADHIDGPTSAEALAAKTHTSADALYRVLRALAAVGVFVEHPGKQFSLTPISQCLRTNDAHSMRAMAAMLNDDWNWTAWSALGHSVATGATAFEHAWGMKVFEYFSKHPDESRRFNEAMTSLTIGVTAAVVAAYDFSEVKHVVDVGGSHGILAAGIVDKFASVRATVFDLPHVIAETSKHLAGNARISTAVGSFFEPLPKADAYIMKSIIHDWDDASCTKILAQCRAAMEPGGRVLIVESLITDGPESTFVKLIDLEMLVVAPGGRERTRDEYAALFQSAGLTLSRVVATKGPFSVIEGRAA